MKLLTSFLLASTFDDVNTSAKSCDGYRCACNGEVIAKWESSMADWKNDQKGKDNRLDMIDEKIFN